MDLVTILPTHFIPYVKHVRTSSSKKKTAKTHTMKLLQHLSTTHFFLGLFGVSVKIKQKNHFQNISCPAMI